MKNYETLEIIGYGAYANAFRVRNVTDDRIYVMKSVRPGQLQQNQQEVIAEASLLASFDHPHVIGYEPFGCCFLFTLLTANSLQLQGDSGGFFRRAHCHGVCRSR